MHQYSNLMLRKHNNCVKHCANIVQFFYFSWPSHYAVTCETTCIYDCVDNLKGSIFCGSLLSSFPNSNDKKGLAFLLIASLEAKKLSPIYAHTYSCFNSCVSHVLHVQSNMI